MVRCQPIRYLWRPDRVFEWEHFSLLVILCATVENLISIPCVATNIIRGELAGIGSFYQLCKFWGLNSGISHGSKYLFKFPIHWLLIFNDSCEYHLFVLWSFKLMEKFVHFSSINKTNYLKHAISDYFLNPILGFLRLP